MYLANQWWLVAAPGNTGSLLDIKKGIDRSKVLKDEVYVDCPPAAKELKMIKGTFQTIECYKI